jgi:hypothetical protein
VFCILEIPTRRPKNTQNCMDTYIYILEFITWCMDSRLWVQFLNATCLCYVDLSVQRSGDVPIP